MECRPNCKIYDGKWQLVKLLLYTKVYKYLDCKLVDASYV